MSWYSATKINHKLIIQVHHKSCVSSPRSWSEVFEETPCSETERIWSDTKDTCSKQSLYSASNVSFICFVWLATSKNSQNGRLHALAANKKSHTLVRQVSGEQWRRQDLRTGRACSRAWSSMVGSQTIWVNYYNITLHKGLQGWGGD